MAVRSIDMDKCIGCGTCVESCPMDVFRLDIIVDKRPEQAQVESERRLTRVNRSRIAYVDDCQVCRLCEHYCPTDAIDITEGQILGYMHAFDVVKIG